jgi:hypothetical protein
VAMRHVSCLARAACTILGEFRASRAFSQQVMGGWVRPELGLRASDASVSRVGLRRISPITPHYFKKQSLVLSSLAVLSIREEKFWIAKTNYASVYDNILVLRSPVKDALCSSHLAPSFHEACLAVNNLLPYAVVVPNDERVSIDNKHM